MSLGRRKAQTSFFDLPFWAQSLFRPDSFFVRMGAFWQHVCTDDDLATMYDESQGRPSVPPSLLCGVLILQCYCNVSDREAERRVREDMGWKLALGLRLDDPGFHFSVLSAFRRRLLEHGKERCIFDKLVQMAIQMGFLRPDAEQVIDSTPIHGAAAQQDTYKLLRSAIRKVLRAVGETPGRRRRLAKRLDLSAYLDSGKPELDWSDPQARKAHLQELVAAAERLLTAAQQDAAFSDREAQGAVALLQQIVCQNIDTDSQGEFEIRQGVAKDRVISTVDPEMRHGRKSASRRINGYKEHVAGDPTAELITEVLVTPANTYDGEAVEPLLDAMAMHNGLVPTAIVGDQSVIDPERRRALMDRGIEPVGKVGSHRKDGLYGKGDFGLDVTNGKVTCPAGHTTNHCRTVKDKKDRSVQVYHFPHELCLRCPMRCHCTNARTTGRTIRIHPYESLLQAARQEQETAAFKERYDQARSTNERMMGHLVRHGIRQGRYLGQLKTQFQALWASGATNLKRLMTLICTRDGPQALAAA